MISNIRKPAVAQDEEAEAPQNLIQKRNYGKVYDNI